MRKACLAALWLALPAASGTLAAPAAPRTETSAQSLDSLKSQLEGVFQDIRALESSLRKFQRDCPPPGEPGAFPPERLQAEKELHALLVRGYDLSRRFYRLRRVVDLEAGVAAIQYGANGDRQGIKPEFASIYQWRVFSQYAQTSLSGTEAFLTQEFLAANRDAELHAAAKAGRKRGLFVLCTAGAAAVALAGLLLLRRRGPPPAAAVLVEAAVPTPTPRPLTAPPAAEPGEGAVLGGRFRLGKALGPGPFGTAYEASDSESGRKALILRIRREIHDSDRDLDRFLSEARKAVQLSNPHVAEVLSVFIEDRRVHVVSELVEGTPLVRVLEGRRAADLATVKRLARQVLEALGYAHDLGVVHGALSPSAIIMNDRELVKVRDFGIGAEARRIAAKLSWGAAGSEAAYMAPEQELGWTLPQSDLYSAGVVLYEAATGRLPFEGPDYLSQKRAMKQPAPSSLNRSLPREFDEAVAKALQPDPRARFASAEEFSLAVELINEGPS